MGITIAYWGRLADLTRIEDFEDRLLDLALEVSGLFPDWCSCALLFAFGQHRFQSLGD